MIRSDRDDRGRFSLGNAGGPGRLKAKTEGEYLAALTEEVSIADWRAIGRKAVEQAKLGDHRARQWLASYLIGKPRETGELVIIEEKDDFDFCHLSKEETYEFSRMLNKIHLEQH